NYTQALQPFLQNYGTAQGGVNQLTDLLGITGNPAGTVGGGGGGSASLSQQPLGGGPGPTTVGTATTTNLQDPRLTALENTPGYKFQLEQGNNAINAAAAASGKNFSGNQLLDLKFLPLAA